jgi:hypothetical protein
MHLTPDVLAKRIARRLFVNGSREHASRLVLELPNKQSGGGWCEEAAADQIEREICRAIEEARNPTQPKTKRAK